LSEQFAQRQVSKRYIAITKNAPQNLTGILEHWHRKEKKKAQLVNEGTPFAEKAKLEYEVKPYGNFYRWDIVLHTGKFHQIRVQLANLNCPIVGDELYGSTTAYLPNAIALHATQLIITHPIKQSKLILEANSNFDSTFNI
jgi:23S rRNA-/tRNA-specific pseudouridylate synthase